MAWRERKINVVLSEEIFQEYIRVAEEIHSTRRLNINLSAVLDLLFMNSEICIPKHLPNAISRDPDDDKFIACALSSNANFIVSGDQDLLHLPKNVNIQVIKPSHFVKTYLVK